MKPAPLVRGLVWGLVASILLPIAVTVTIGTGGLLAAVGDQAAAAVCRRVALVLGILWITALAGTTIVSGLIAAARGGRPEPRRRHRRRRDRRPPRDAGR